MQAEEIAPTCFKTLDDTMNFAVLFPNSNGCSVSLLHEVEVAGY